MKAVWKIAFDLSDREINLKLSMKWLEMKEFLFQYQLSKHLMVQSVSVVT